VPPTGPPAPSASASVTATATGTSLPQSFGPGGAPARAGTIDVAIPKLRQGTYFPDWLLERRKRAEAALTSVVATCYLLGVSTRRMDKMVQALGITGLSRSQVSRMAADLDAQVEAFRTRPLDQGPYTFVAADALTMKVREGGRVVIVHALIATGVNADGFPHRCAAGGAPAGRSWACRSPPPRTGPGGWPSSGTWPPGAPVRGASGDFRCPRRAGRGDRGDPAGSHVAEVPDPLRGEPGGPVSQGQLVSTDREN
jgi:hypothetical protein